MNRSVELYIESLVLHGVSQREASRIKVDIERELTYLFSTKGIPKALIQENSLQHLDAGSFQVQDHKKTTSTGMQIARSMYAGFTNIK